MKSVFSGPSGRRKWKKPKKDELNKPGDWIKIKGGTLHVMSIDPDGLTHMEARSNSTGEVLKFAGRRTSNGDWSDEIQANLANVPESAIPFLKEMGAEKSLPPFNPDLISVAEGQGWLNDYTAAAMSQRVPLRSVNEYSPSREQTIGHLMDKATEAKQNKVRIEREIAHMKVRGPKNEPTTPEEYQADIKAVVSALKGGLKLEKPQGSSLHHFRQFLYGTSMNNMDRDEMMFLMNDFQSIVIEHDWAQAFANVPGMMDEGEVPMPFDWTCFEFRITGLRVLVMMGQEDCFLCTGVNSRWYVSDERFKFHDNGTFTLVSGDKAANNGFSISEAQEFLKFLGKQIRAACIMLDAQVAEADPREPSDALNKQRAKQGKVPLKTYHVVRLHRKHSAPRGIPGAPTGRQVRAHVRRGHWRHYKEGDSGHEQMIDRDGHLRSRTWINWMVVGDINLGFIDKEYRL